MKRIVAAILTLNLAVPSMVLARSKSDEAAIRNLPQAFCDAWNLHDGHALAQVMTNDVDFVTVGAMWLHGRPDFEKSVDTG
jgi:ketosteroid isomerase-like protein